VARALTHDELQRYPWASQITDYVPVGLWRKIAVACTWVAAVILIIGILVTLGMASNVHHALRITHPLLAGACVGAAGLAAIGILLGLVTGVQAVAKGYRSLLLWSVAAVVPAAVLLFITYELAK